MREKEPITALVADVDAAAVVEQGALADGDAVADRKVVAVGEVDAVVDFHAGAHVVEDVAAQHAAEAQSQPVIQPDRRAVEHLPEPEQRLALRVARRGRRRRSAPPPGSRFPGRAKARATLPGSSEVSVRFSLPPCGRPR